MNKFKIKVIITMRTREVFLTVNHKTQTMEQKVLLKIHSRRTPVVQQLKSQISLNPQTSEAYIYFREWEVVLLSFLLLYESKSYHKIQRWFTPLCDYIFRHTFITKLGGITTYNAISRNLLRDLDVMDKITPTTTVRQRV